MVCWDDAAGYNTFQHIDCTLLPSPPWQPAAPQQQQQQDEQQQDQQQNQEQQQLQQQQQQQSALLQQQVEAHWRGQQQGQPPGEVVYSEPPTPVIYRWLGPPGEAGVFLWRQLNISVANKQTPAQPRGVHEVWLSDPITPKGSELGFQLKGRYIHSFIVTPVAPVHNCNRACLFSSPLCTALRTTAAG